MNIVSYCLENNDEKTRLYPRGGVCGDRVSGAGLSVAVGAMPQGGTKVVTNRVVLTKEQAEKLLKSRKGQKVKKVKVDVAGNTAN